MFEFVRYHVHPPVSVTNIANSRQTAKHAAVALPSAGFSLVLRIFRIFGEKEEIMGHIIWQFVKWFAIGVVAFLIVMVLLSDLGMLGIAASGVLVGLFAVMLAALINASVFLSKYKDNPAQDIREEDRREKEYNVRLAKLMAAIAFPCIAIWAIAVYCLIIF